ncbi:putative RNA-directed DNA polymerase from transposon BS [Trichonephila clavipes]|nr:putative RNA-directed DNA polymerase from transposon BS [Trichonephila clavipes]
MEIMMLRRLTYFLDSNNLLPREQYGFRRGHSTEDQILYFCQRVRDAQNLKPTNHTTSAFLDLSKAFDMVWRNKLILKMFDVFGIKGKALPWISYLFKSRVIRVKYNKSLSKDFKLSQGVPQVSVLSPMLFSMFLAGVEKLITEKSSTGLFADDIVLWHSSHDIPSIEANLSINANGTVFN